MSSLQIIGEFRVDEVVEVEAGIDPNPKAREVRIVFVNVENGFAHKNPPAQIVCDLHKKPLVFTGKRKARCEASLGAVYLGCWLIGWLYCGLLDRLFNR